KGTTLHGGNIFLEADRQVTVSGAINTTGLAGITGANPIAAGGIVTIGSLSSFVSTGAISTNANNITTAGSTQPGGRGGDIIILADSSITTGTLLANGGSTVGSGGGGDGGDVSFGTGLINIAGTQMAQGFITVNGFINAAGGNASKLAGGAGGKGGVIAL